MVSWLCLEADRAGETTLNDCASQLSVPFRMNKKYWMNDDEEKEVKV
jgi:hypothetical protein